ncbi:hypothetical protein A3Q56_02399 [Intoshia linei]|uniref:non-specific serine/threonine protein kinase n=1 Tax=Intoshia linei TaxID=1819745 RepID=A0A177B6D9_9BILA|nr:hypothetical protein A3Q56_02399 [Intoshia linei]
MSQIEKQQLVHEVNLLRKLNHPNIVRYHDRIIDKINSKLYLIMEYCINGDLSKLINLKKKTGGMFAEKFIWKIASQITSALKVCHNKSFNKENKVILHRDIKPANIFLDEEYNVKLGDFGLAKSLPSSLEYALTVAGTPNYMSPEQIKMEPYNNKSDVWSLGCLIYELATLNHPFGGNCAKDLAFCICTARFKPVADTYSIEMKNFVQLLLNPDVNWNLFKIIICIESRKAINRTSRKIYRL